MTPSAVKSEISRLISCLLELECAVSVNGAVIRRQGPDTLVTWASQSVAALSDHVYGSVQEYRHALHSREYTALLIDGALLQISFTFNRDEIIAQRFCYYPCPLVLDADDATLDLVEIIDLRLAEEFEAQKRGLGQSDGTGNGYRLRLRGPLRFEFDAMNAAASHPASHLHVISEDARWPIFGPISVGHFVRFIFTHFYADLDLVPLREWPVNQHNRTVTPEHETTLFIECHHRF